MAKRSCTTTLSWDTANTLELKSIVALLDDTDDDGGGGGHDDIDVDLDLLPAVPRLQLWATLFQLQKFTWIAKVEAVEEEDEPLVRVVVDADVQELVLHEADGGEPGRLVAGEDRHHVCSLSLTSNN